MNFENEKKILEAIFEYLATTGMLKSTIINLQLKHFKRIIVQ